MKRLYGRTDALTQSLTFDNFCLNPLTLCSWRAPSSSGPVLACGMSDMHTLNAVASDSQDLAPTTSV